MVAATHCISTIRKMCQTWIAKHPPPPITEAEEPPLPESVADIEPDLPPPPDNVTDIRPKREEKVTRLQDRR